MIDKVFYAMLVITWLKSITIGSTFNFWLWLKYGRDYFNWYRTLMEQEYKPNYKEE